MEKRDRCPLNAGDIVYHTNEEYYSITCLLGQGGSCYVYEANYIRKGIETNPIKVILKECCPKKVVLGREENGIIWSDEYKKAESLNRFHNAFELSGSLWNDTNVLNYIANGICYFEANQTAYYVVPLNQGVTYGKLVCERLKDMVYPIYLLTHAISVYHEKGLLHLDIKPDNFLVFDKPSEHIILFDFDTVVCKVDVKQGNLSAIPYSDGFSAPEIISGNIRNIDERTDLFSIGATLFLRLMGRCPQLQDSTIFANWDFCGTLLEKESKEVKQFFKKIFRKTLASSISRRYASALELKDDLEEILNYLSASDLPHLVLQGRRKGADAWQSETLPVDIGDALEFQIQLYNFDSMLPGTVQIELDKALKSEKGRTFAFDVLPGQKEIVFHAMVFNKNIEFGINRLFVNVSMQSDLGEISDYLELVVNIEKNNIRPDIVQGFGDNGSENHGTRRLYSLQELNDGLLGNVVSFNRTKDRRDPVLDQSRFLGIRKNNGIHAGKNNLWTVDNMRMSEDGTYLLRIYVNNNGPDGIQYAGKDTKVAIILPNGSDTQIAVQGRIFSSNATPSYYWDNLVLLSDRRFRIEYIKGSAFIQNNGIGKSGGYPLSDEIVKDGVLIGFDQLDGIVPAGYKYAAYIFISVKVTFE